MERKPITPMLKVVSILHIIQAAISTFSGIMALALYAAMPSLTEITGQDPGLETTPLTYISLIILLVCAIVDIVLSVMALKHKNLGIVYKIAIVSTMFSVVFSAAGSQVSVSSYISLFIGLIIPFLFLIALFKQNKLDEGK